ncbi:hypothetical protein FB451DRAFT_1307892, partial [Mycena latifolia]
MPSPLGHHDQNPPGGPPSPKAGTVHPRPADNASSHEGQPVTKSPSTRRIVKRTRVQHPSLDPLDFFADTAPSPSPPLAAPAEHPEPPVEQWDLFEEQPEGEGPWSDDQRPLLNALVAILERANATLDAIELGGPVPPYDSILQRLSTDLQARICPTSPPIIAPTYASVASTAHTPRSDPIRSAPPPAPARNRAPPEPSVPARKSKKPHSPRRPRHSPHRLILRWTGSPPEARATVTVLAAALDKAAREHHAPPYVQGVNWTSNGNLVIHAHAPYTASQLSAVHGEAILEAVRRECGHFQGPAVLEVDSPWVSLVLHGVPAAPLLDSLKFEQEGFWTTLETTGNSATEVKSVRVLCRQEEYREREKVSLKLTFSDASAAHRMMLSGAFLFGTHC